MAEKWIDVGKLESFPDGKVTEAVLGKTPIAITRRGGQVGVISGVCNHVGGPLG